MVLGQLTRLFEFWLLCLNVLVFCHLVLSLVLVMLLCLIIFLFLQICHSLFPIRVCHVACVCSLCPYLVSLFCSPRTSVFFPTHHAARSPLFLFFDTWTFIIFKEYNNQHLWWNLKFPLYIFSYCVSYYWKEEIKQFQMLWAEPFLFGDGGVTLCNMSSFTKIPPYLSEGDFI